MSRKIDTIVVHAAATSPDMDIGVKEIRQWHLDRGWNDIGYHVVITRDGTGELGRPFEIMGAHAYGYNRTSIGVCLVGGVTTKDRTKPEANFTLAQYKALAEWVEYLQGKFGPGLAVVGHSKYNAHKACPVFDVDSLLSHLGTEKVVEKKGCCGGCKK